jgi:transposase-like protein
MSHLPPELKPKCPRCKKDTLVEKFHRGEPVYCCYDCRWCWHIDDEMLWEAIYASTKPNRKRVGKTKRSSV